MQPLNDKQLWFSILFVVAAGLQSELASPQAKEYCQQLIQPHYAPPAWIFGLVWTTLSILLGISLYFILIN